MAYSLMPLHYVMSMNYNNYTTNRLTFLHFLSLLCGTQLFTKLLLKKQLFLLNVCSILERQTEVLKFVFFVQLANGHANVPCTLSYGK